MTNELLGTHELLYPHGELKDWNGRRYAELRYPRGSWRTLFMTSDTKVRLIRPDGSALVAIEPPDSPTIKTFPVWDGGNERIGTFERRRRLSFKDSFEVLDANGTLIGTAQGNGSDSQYKFSDSTDRQIAVCGLQGADTWSIDLVPDLSKTWTLLVIGFAIAAGEAATKLPDIG